MCAQLRDNDVNICGFEKAKKLQETYLKLTADCVHKQQVRENGHKFVLKTPDKPLTKYHNDQKENKYCSNKSCYGRFGLQNNVDF